MKPLLCWVTVHACLCFRSFHSTERQRVVSFHVANQTSMADSGPVFSPVSKVKCTLICLEHTSCTSVFYWRSEEKCQTNTTPQAPDAQGGPGNVTRQDAKVHRQDPKSKVTKQDPERKVYYGVLRDVSIIKSEQYIYFKEIGLSLIHHLVNKTWKKAEPLCFREGGHLFVIDNQAQQDAAKRLVEVSGQELIFFGLYNDFFTWKYGDSRYTNWAPGEPHLPTFAALSRSSGYKWVTTGQHDRASWICAKRDK